jgi:hypothetical protein
MTVARVHMFDLNVVDDVTVEALRPAVPLNQQAVVTISNTLSDIILCGPITGLRAVAVEIDRQLARLEVESRIDTAPCNEKGGAL